MKLYLSSTSIPHPQELRALLPSDQKLTAAVIPNAWDVDQAGRRDPAIRELNQAFAGIGIAPVMLDLRELKGEELRQQLTNHPLVWLMGGNTFYINHLLHESGFSGFIKPLLANGLVYGGESAGAVVAGSTLRGIQLLDDPAESPRTIWEGLGLIASGIVPHWGDQSYADLLEQCRTEMAQHAEVITITDHQAIVVNGEIIQQI